MDDISKNIKKVMVVFLIIFIILISYISYFEIVTAPKIVNSPYNRRMWAKRNEFLRGTIYDRDMKPLSKSHKIDEKTQKREYIGGAAFSQVLGYVDIRYGITGLESSYDRYLIGENTEGIIDYINRKVLSLEKRGNSIVSTLDYELQKKAYELMGNNRGSVVAMNPKTGEILALVSKPSFDPNKLDKNWDEIIKDEHRPLLNRATTGLYPPGSVFKTVTAVSALENMEDIEKRIFQDKGELVFNNEESLSNYAHKALGDINLEEAYVNSSNVVFGTLGLELGNENLKKTAEKFYFNKEIPSEGINIEESRFPSYKKYESGNIAQSAIGQSEILATPVEMALVTSAIANDGVIMKPTLLKKILNHKGDTIKEYKKDKLKQITTKEIADLIKSYMRKTVQDGTGKTADIRGVSIAGKTGTADHDDVKGRVEEPHSWFTALAPYENPEIVVSVIVEDGGVGGGKAASIASKVIREYLELNKK